MLQGGPRDQVSRVLFVSLAGGLEGSVRSLITLVHHLDIPEKVVACPRGGALSRLLDVDPTVGPRIALPTAGRRSRPAAARVVARWLGDQQGHTVIHANGFAEVNVVAFGAARHRLPVTVWVHEWAASRSLRLLSRTWRLLPDMHFACVSEVAEALAHQVAPWVPTTIVPNPMSPSEVLAEGRTEHDPVTVGYVGSAQAYKGFQIVPELVELLDGDRLNWRIYAGPPHSMPDTWRRLRERSDRVEICGKVDDVREAYRHLDIVVCPSVHESFGRVAAEAMLNGIPVVATDIPALRAVIGDAGVLVPPGAPGALAEAIRRLAGNPGLRSRLGEIGRRRAEQYAPIRIARQMSELYARRS